MHQQSVALLHYSAPPVVGGVESVLAQHARLLADAGHSVCVVAGRGAPFDARIKGATVPMVDSRHPDVLAVKADLDAGRVPPGFATLVEAVTTALSPFLENADVLVAHNVCSLHKNLALTAALHAVHRQAGAPALVLWHHDLAWTTPRYRAELHDGYPWDLLRGQWDATHVVVSELRRRELARLLDLSPEAIAVVPNGVDAAEFLNLGPDTRWLVRLMRLADHRPVLLLPVRLTPRKNIELALRALACLRVRFPAAALVVTGPPGPHNPANADYFARLKALRAELGLDNAAWFLAEFAHGYLPDAVIADFYRLADGLLLPSREEGFGIPLLEAAISRLPVFCSDIPPLRELGAEDVCYFSPDADPETVAGMIASRVGQDGRYRFAARVREGFTWTRIYSEHIAPLLVASAARRGLAER